MQCKGCQRLVGRAWWMKARGWHRFPGSATGAAALKYMVYILTHPHWKSFEHLSRIISPWRILQPQPHLRNLHLLCHVHGFGHAQPINFGAVLLQVLQLWLTWCILLGHGLKGKHKYIYIYIIYIYTYIHIYIYIQYNVDQCTLQTLGLPAANPPYHLTCSNPRV